MIVDRSEKYALLRVQFAVSAPEEKYEWGVKDKREFDNLKAALADAKKAVTVLPGTEAVEKSLGEGQGARKDRKKRAWRERMKNAKAGRTRSRRVTRGSDEHLLEQLVKAARFVRGDGAAAIHPGDKMKLFGLLMQALKGDCPRSRMGSGELATFSKETTNSGFWGSVLALKRLKLKAWLACAGKGRKEAMVEYIALITSLAPQWKIAGLIHGRSKQNSSKKAKVMTWVLR